MGHTQSKWKGGGGVGRHAAKSESENENGEAETQRKTATQRELESFIFQELHLIFIQTGKKYMYIRETDRKQTLIVQELCESRWPSWAVRPNEPSGFRGRKAILNHACP